jgi:uncharacterized protein DUF3485
MDPMLRIFPPLTAMIAVVACGTVHGLWTDRWHVSDEPAASVARLGQVPTSLPDWDGEAVPTEGKQFKSAAGHLYYQFVHRRTGQKVTLFMVCDRPGPVAIHTPDVCYGAVGFEVTTPIKYSLQREDGAAPATFWTARFKKKTASDASDLRIFWSWSATGGWDAADEPRLTFARYPVLFKIYIIRELTGTDDALDQEPCVQLLRQLLPELQRTLFAAS